MSEGSTEDVLTLDTEDDLAGSANTESDLDPEQARLKEAEEELKKIRTFASEDVFNIAKEKLTLEEKMEMDSRSIYIGNVDYTATSTELEQHFHGCGGIKRVSIQLDKFTSKPKGFAYIEFDQKDSVDVSLALDESLFKGRQIKVSQKRTNHPGISSTNRPPRGRFRRPSRGGLMYGTRRPHRRAGFRRAAFRPY